MTDRNKYDNNTDRAPVNTTRVGLADARPNYAYIHVHSTSKGVQVKFVCVELSFSNQS